MTREEHELKILDYFNKNIRQREQELLNTKFYTEFVKIHYTFYDFSKSITFSPDPVDFAIWDVNKKKFVCIEYPWRNKNGKLVYNKINL
jgi:hypothetical protein